MVERGASRAKGSVFVLRIQLEDRYLLASRFYRLQPDAGY